MTTIIQTITCTRKEAYLQSLVENIASTKPGTMDFARELKRLRDEGWEYTKIAKVACKTAECIRQYSVPFVRELILKTPVAKRAKLSANGFSPWEKSEKKNDDLLKRLQEVEEKQEFYAGLYRQYSYNLLKLIIYVQSLMANELVHAKLAEQHAGLLVGFREIVEGSEG